MAKEDLEQGRLSSVDQGMGKDNGGLRCHGVKCEDKTGTILGFL